jgi:hypothetical protein
MNRQNMSPCALNDRLKRPTSPEEIEWVVDFSYLNEYSAGGLLFGVLNKKSIDQYIDLKATHSFRVERMFNRVAP